MAGDLKDPALEDFLRRVEELESVVKGDAAIGAPQEGAVSPAKGSTANVRQQRDPVDRTVINRAAFRDDHRPKESQGRDASASVGQDAFMLALEADANQRAEKRRKRKEEATVFKEQGNREFQAGNYKAAVELYTQGLDQLKDFVVLYTNRAQAYNKLERFQEAIEDCQTALRLEPENVKAHVHLGKAHQGLSDYATAIQTYQEILKFDSSKDKMVQEYIANARLSESMAASTSEAKRLFEAGDSLAKGVHQILTRLQQPHQPVPYYAGGMRILSAALNDDSSRAQFRTFDGFKLLTDHTVIPQALNDAVEGVDSVSDGRDLVCATFDLLTSAVKENEENIFSLMDQSLAPSMIVDLLSNASYDIQVSCIGLLYTVSQNATGGQRILERFDVFRFLTALLVFLQPPKAHAVNTATTVADLLNSIILQERFIARFSTTSAKADFDVFNKAVSMLLMSSGKVSPAALLQVVNTLTTLARDEKLRGKLMSRRLLPAAVKALERYAKKQRAGNFTDGSILLGLVSLLMNVFVDHCPMSDMGMVGELKSLLGVTDGLLSHHSKDVRQRAIGLLSRIMPTTDEEIAHVASGSIVPKIVQILKSDSENCSNFGLKCLAVLTQRSDKARKDLVKTDNELECIREQLNRNTDISIANAALVIGQCTQVAGLGKSLVHTDIVRTLLSKTDTMSAPVKENCAIALAKLSTTDERHLQQLRDLGGIGILHSCMKYVKS